MSVSNGPSIVTSGLVLSLDAADRNSYPGSGTTWRDLSGNGNNATLINGPTFTSANGGAIVFDGVDDYSINSVTFTAAMTVITIAKSNTATNWSNTGGLGSARAVNGYIMHNTAQTATTTMYVCDSSGNPIGVSSAWPVSNVANYNFFALTTNGTNTHTTYINNNVIQTYIASITRTASSTQNNYLGQDSTLPGRNTNLNIAYHLIYNRELSALEIQQNYNTLKTRFGL